jgi:hypothetical protein
LILSYLLSGIPSASDDGHAADFHDCISSKNQRSASLSTQTNLKPAGGNGSSSDSKDRDSIFLTLHFPGAREGQWLCRCRLSGGFVVGLMVQEFEKTFDNFVVVFRSPPYYCVLSADWPAYLEWITALVQKGYFLSHD